MNELTFDKVSFSYPKQPLIFENVSFKLQLPNPNRGHIVALMGASGSGKSTILKLILKTLSPQKGNIYTNPHIPIISYLPQDAVLFDHLSPLQNARYFERIIAYKDHFNGDLFEQLSDMLGMSSVFNTTKSISELSGGQRQRLSLLRALSIKPNVLLLDEPTNGIDSDVKIQLLQELRRIVVEQKILAIYVTHHKTEAELCADEVLYLYKSGVSQANQVFQNTIENFIETPPFLDAVKVFNYPHPNIIKCFIENNTLQMEGAGDNLFVSIKSENITFTNQSGFDFDVITSTPVFTTIKLNTDNLLTVPTNKIVNSNNCKLVFNGKLNIFDNSYKYLKTIDVLNNKIE